MSITYIFERLNLESVYADSLPSRFSDDEYVKAQRTFDGLLQHLLPHDQQAIRNSELVVAFLSWSPNRECYVYRILSATLTSTALLNENWASALAGRHIALLKPLLVQA